MNPLTPNPVTGFLESINPSALDTFTSDKKLKFLQLAKLYADRRELPDTYKILEAIRVNYNTFNEHLGLDEKFRDAWNEIRRAVSSGMANELSVKAKSKGGIIANLAVLKYLETGSWLNDQRLIVGNDSGSLKTAIHRNKDFIDAEIVEPRQISDGKPT